MPIPESQLETWSHQGSITQSSNTYNSIKNVLEAGTTPYASKNFKVFLQGSYGNDTNIYAESDVDIVIRLDDCFFMKIALGAPAMVSLLGPGCGVSASPPTLVAGLAVVGSPVLASGSFAPPFAAGELFSSAVISQSTLANGCQLYLGGSGVRSHGQFAVNANGAWSLPGLIPNAEALVGQAFGVQALFLSPSAPTGYAVSAGVRMVVGY